MAILGIILKPRAVVEINTLYFQRSCDNFIDAFYNLHKYVLLHNSY